MFFLLLWPLFARAPRHWFLENFLLSAPGVQSVCFFLLRSVGRRDPSAGPEQKKNTTQGVFFLLRPRGKAGEGEAPCRHGARAKKKHHPGCFFFAPAPGKGRGRRSPVPARGQSKKKKHHPGCFFLLRPRGKAREGKKKTPPRVFFFAPAPGKGKGRRSPLPAPTGLLLPLPFPGAGAKKTHPGWCFFLLRPRADGASPSPAPRGRSKKNTPWVVFFFAALTHCGPGWRCLPLAGVVFFFFAAAPPGPGWCFFLLWPRPDAHSLTVGWGDFGKARVVFFFFCCGPAGSF